MSFWSWIKRALTPSSKPVSKVRGTWQIDHTPWCGPLKDQGDTMQCTAYAVTSSMEWWSNKNGTPKRFAPAPLFARQGSANTSLALIRALREGTQGYRITDYVPVQIQHVKQQLEISPIICDMLITPAFVMGYNNWERHAVLMVACSETEVVLQNSWPDEFETMSWNMFINSKPECHRITGITKLS